MLASSCSRTKFSCPAGSGSRSVARKMMILSLLNPGEL